MNIRKSAGRNPGSAVLLLAVSPSLLIGPAFGLGKIVRDCSLTCNVGYKLSPAAIFMEHLDLRYEFMRDSLILVMNLVIFSTLP